MKFKIIGIIFEDGLCSWCLIREEQFKYIPPIVIIDDLAELEELG